MVPELISLDGDITLRLLRESDAEAIFRVVEQEREHLGRWLIWVDSTHEPADTRKFLASVEKKRVEGETYAYGIWSGGELLGLCGLHDISRINANAQVGYWLREGQQGRGVMTLAVDALLSLGFAALDLQRIELRAAEGNQRSWRIAERLGFRMEGTMRNLIRLRDGYADARLYSLLREEWLAQPSRSSAP
jgi:ribosomal-protein-serine acetyltransferase